MPSGRAPRSAMPASRLRAVVVLPTPPFWLNTAIVAIGTRIPAGRGTGPDGMRASPGGRGRDGSGPVSFRIHRLPSLRPCRRRSTSSSSPPARASACIPRCRRCCTRSPASRWSRTSSTPRARCRRGRSASCTGTAASAVREALAAPDLAFALQDPPRGHRRCGARRAAAAAGRRRHAGHPRRRAAGPGRQPRRGRRGRARAGTWGCSRRRWPIRRGLGRVVRDPVRPRAPHRRGARRDARAARASTRSTPA